MKYILIILLSFSFSARSQTRVVQMMDYVYQYNSATIRSVNNCINATCWQELQPISNSTVLAKIYNDGLVLWDATLAAANVSDTLSATGITGMCRVTVPTTVNTQRVIQYGDYAIIYSTVTYTSAPQYALSIYPLIIRRNSDQVVICITNSGFVVDWVTTPLPAWFGRVGTTRIKRITLT